MTQPETISITIAAAHPDGRRADRQTSAEKHGPFGVHRCPLTREERWKATHIATGFLAAEGPTKAACTHAAWLLQLMPVDWDFTDGNTPATWPADLQQQVRVIRAACAAGGEA